MFSFCVKARPLHYESCGIGSDLDFSKFEMAQSCRLCRRLWTVNESTGLFYFYNFCLNMHNIIYIWCISFETDLPKWDVVVYSALSDMSYCISSLCIM